MDQGYAYLTVAIGGDGWLQFNGVKSSGKNYVAQEVDSLMQIAKEAWALK